MGDATERLFAAAAVMFRYKQQMRDGSVPLDYGLIAEEVADMFPELVVTTPIGQLFDGVKYQSCARCCSTS